MLKVMIVDDEAIILKGLQHMIRQAGTLFTEIEGVSDSVEALRMVDEYRPDLIISDIQMPELNGLELIKAASQKKPDTRFIILSGYDLFEYAREAVRLNVADYLLKPVDPKELIGLLTRLSMEIVEQRKQSQEEPAEEGDGETYENNENIRKFKEFILGNYMHDISLEEVASHLELHPSYVCSLLKRETGMTYVQYLRTVRIEKAKSLLSGMPNLPMDQISKNIGFENPRHFYKVFKQQVGVTPGHYRTSVTNG
ncbi:response regulator [Paenibacillus sp. N4]|uniref:response regulator transcription factor n=1 Tax=Paenibacillus vietnamensis TaxID=2590547 RepID=UPI001CD1255A|nr:response regulator [Paenibacillus vietnamensis]MCA0755955.1 response regulator [Paenibacillus vietnamensis]